MCSRAFRPLVCPSMLLASPRLHSRCYRRSFTFYVVHPIRSIETRSLPALTRSYLRHFAFYAWHAVALGEGGSLIPFAPLYLGSSRCARPLPSRRYRPCCSSHSLHSGDVM